MVINLALSNFDVKFFGFQHVHPRDRLYFFPLNTNQDTMDAIKPTALLEIATEFSSCSKTGKSNGALKELTLGNYGSLQPSAFAISHAVHMEKGENESLGRI